MKKFNTVILLTLASIWFFWPGTGMHWVEFNVNEGQNAHDVARVLKEAGMIQSQVPFLMWVKFRGASSKLQIGRYRISNGRSAFWIVDDLIQGRAEKAKVVVPEGFASWQIAKRLDDLKVCDGAAFLKEVQAQNAEGFLFPATYELPGGLAPASVIHKMKTEFDHRWTAELDARAAAIGMTKVQAVTLASIIEREVRAREELPIVSAVYHNRLKKRMRLEADPTVQYALGFWKTRLTYDDYHNTKSPYNTYLNSGLPPGPICSPGWDSVKAALWPAASDALFFVAQEDGHHSFSSTYREHTNKVNKRNRMYRKS